MNSRKSLQAVRRSMKQIANKMTVKMCVIYFDENMMTQYSVAFNAALNTCQGRIIHLTSVFIWIPDLTVLKVLPSTLKNVKTPEISIDAGKWNTANARSPIVQTRPIARAKCTS